jgi:DNA-binding MarR family transcriptional regulator
MRCTGEEPPRIARKSNCLTVNLIDYQPANDYPPRVPNAPVDEEVVIPALLRAARGSYSQAIGLRLAEAGFEDLPRNGGFVLGGMSHHGGSAVDMIRGLGVTKQAASQLIDSLVLRGYLTRELNPEDRRRMTIELTERGRAGAAAVRSGIQAIDAELAAMLTESELAGLRAGLVALARIKERAQEGA